MLRAMVQLAPRGGGGDGIAPALADLRALAEHPEPGDRVYVIAASADGELVARAQEVDGQSRYGFPFRRPSGPQSAQLGPVLKRSSDPKKGVGPKESILGRTLEHFEKQSLSGLPVAPVYRQALDALGAGSVADKTARLVRVLAGMSERKTVYVSLGPPPGSEVVYAEHLLSVLRGELYGIDEAAPVGACPVCDRPGALGDTALKGAKINFLNRDNHGFFPGMDAERATARFALCVSCADAIAKSYIGLKDELRVFIAGHPALVLPEVVTLGPATETTHSAWDVVTKYREGKGSSAAEGELLEVLKEESSLVNFHILWAVAGDSLDDVTGFVTDVPCTRLGDLSRINAEANQWKGGVLPPDRVRPFDLRLSLVGEVLKHPGGKRVDRRNGARLGALRRQIARAVYLRAPMAERALMREVRDILCDHLVDPTVDDKFVAYNFTQMPARTKKGEVRLNAASWVRHVALLLHYLRRLKVLPAMSSAASPPARASRVTELLDSALGADTDPKRFAFLMGVLFGRLLTVQAAKGVNVRSNALTWLRRGTLTGADLPGLYVKIREKFAEYGTEGSAAVREVVTEVSALGVRLGTTIALDADTAMYFLFLGQALSGEVFPKSDPQPTEAR